MSEMRNAIQAVTTGLRDGWALGNPAHGLSSGVTFPDHRLTELYDVCVNVGASCKLTHKHLGQAADGVKLVRISVRGIARVARDW